MSIQELSELETIAFPWHDGWTRVRRRKKGKPALALSARVSTPVTPFAANRSKLIHQMKNKCNAPSYPISWSSPPPASVGGAQLACVIPALLLL